MSVYVRPDAKDNVYSYDFRIRGRRFSGSTGKTSRREAEQVEKSERERAKLEIAAEAAVNSAEMTVRAALARYWSEVGQHHANADNTLRALTWLETHFGPNTPLHDIDSSHVAAMVAKRRGEFVPSQRKPGRKYKSPEVRKRVSP
ncbi:MAG: integrase, partial [Reyranellaceae bacterium]